MTVGADLGLRDLPVDPQSQILDFLRDKSMLLVLDNCEHMVTACAAMITNLLVHAPGVRVIATSRQVLGVAGEHLLHISPLPVPPDGTEFESDAVTLLNHRISALDEKIDLGRAGRLALAGICRRLDGVPLAIELAATWFRVLAPQEVLESLEEQFRLLNLVSQARPPRQRTLSAALDWSYDLCSAAEKATWARLSVFSGGLTLAGADEVGVPDELSTEHGALELVAGLVDKSILARDENRSIARYRMLETVREYGLARLAESGDATDAHVRHRNHFLRLAVELHPLWAGSRQVEAATTTRRELANFRAALSFSLTDTEDPLAAARLAVSLGPFWTTSGHFGEARLWIERLLENRPLPDDVRLEALFILTFSLVALGEHQTAADRAAEALAVSSSLHDDYLQAVALLCAGGAAFVGDDLARADLSYTTAEELLHRSGRTDLKILMCYAAHSMAVAFAGDAARAARLARRCVAIADELGEQWTKSYALYGLAVAEWREGHAAEATRLTRECVEIKHRFNDVIGLAMPVELLAWISSSTGDGERAARLLGAASQIWRYGGGKPMLNSQNWSVPHARCVEETKQILGVLRYQTIFTEGQDLSPDVDAAVALVLGRDRDPSSLDEEEPSAQRDVLTRRELEIAELVADGASNKAIASRLVISPRTVSTHLQNIMGKLGFNSRTQIATWITHLRNQ
ncbi:LuxR C-terminal-related transcriptional regulator [Lentzea sp. NPDC034063]|uniref:helix-turn-helix transcriptional regulator n=1 Tax=unclassified Lentzea TaxID=2643253 RepID=UPI00340EBFA4